MKVLHLQYRSTSSGNYTITLHNLMSAYGIESKVLSLYKSTAIDDENILQIPGRLPNVKANFDYKIQGFLNRNNRAEYGLYSFPIFGTDISTHPEIMQADIIYVHWVLHGFLNIHSLSKLACLGKPLVFVLHDMWAFTGGCHHSFDCKKYKVECKDCQILQPSRLIDRANILFSNKLKFFNSFENLFFIAPSIWIKKEAESSILLKNKTIKHIPNSVSPTYNYPLNKSEAKKSFGIDSNKKIIGFGANYLKSPYKGFEYLLDALGHLKSNLSNHEIEILVFGSDLSEKVINEIPFKVHYTGYITSESKIGQAYNAMDVFVVPSIADNLPTTVLESLMCSTPVVGFNVGGIPDMIDHKKNGYLAEYRDSMSLANGIIFCSINNLKGYLKRNFFGERIIANHFELFEEIKNFEL